MRTKLFTFFLVLVAGIGTMYASNKQVDGIWYDFDTSKLTASVTYKGSSYMEYNDEYSGTLAIPSTVTYNNVTYSVTSIRYYAFAECTSLTSVVIGNRVTSIGTCAFYSCTGLTSITIPNSVTDIGSSAFQYCNNLTSIEIPNSITNIGFCVFSNCTNLTSVTIPNSVTSIGGSAFDDCISLTSITIPNSVTSIESRAFSGCSGLTSVHISDIASWCSISFENINSNPLYYAHNLYLNDVLITNMVIPNSVTNIDSYTFVNCTSLTSIEISNIGTDISENAFYGCNIKEIHYVGTIQEWLGKLWVASYVSSNYALYIDGELLTDLIIPNSVTRIENEAFCGCCSLTSVSIPNSVISIGFEAFGWCTSLISIEIPNSVTSISDWTFKCCSSLTSIEIPNSVTSIGADAFWECTSLTSVTIPNSVTFIGDGAFYNCTNLTSVTCKAIVPPLLDTRFSGVFDGVDKSIPLYVPNESIGAYKVADYWKDFTNILAIEEATKVIYDTSENQKLSSKLLRDGQILILRGDKTYTLTGQQVR